MQKKIYQRTIIYRLTTKGNGMKKVNIALSTDVPVKVESTFKELNSRGFVRGVTDQDQWFLLVNDGWKKTQLPMDHMVRDYLVTMLHRNSRNTALFDRLSAFHHAEHLFGKRRIDSLCASDAADMCLQSAALFPEYNLRRHEMKSYNYTVELGNNLYHQLAKESSGKSDWFSKAYAAMEKSFGLAIIVLRGTCPRFLNNNEVFRQLDKEAILFSTDSAASLQNKRTNELRILYLETYQLYNNTSS